MRPQPQDFKRGKKQPNTRSVAIALDPDTADRFQEAKDRLDLARRMVDMKLDRPAKERAQADEELMVADEEYCAAKTALDEDSQVFTFRSIGRRAYEELLIANQPTPSQIKKAKEEDNGDLNWNPDTFPVALLAASIIDPQMEEADIKEIWDSPEWSASEALSLFMAALEANSTRRVIDLPKGSNTTGGSL